MGEKFLATEQQKGFREDVLKLEMRMGSGPAAFAGPMIDVESTRRQDFFPMRRTSRSQGLEAEFVIRRKVVPPICWGFSRRFTSGH
jgi:hypothetical protein